MYVYSSGSVEAQKLLFENTEELKDEEEPLSVSLAGFDLVWEIKVDVHRIRIRPKKK